MFIKTPKRQDSESFQVGEHIHVLRGWSPPDSSETDAPVLGTLLDLDLQTSIRLFICILYKNL